MVTALIRIEGRADRRHRQQPDASRRRHRQPRRPTRRRASCSSATPSTSRCCCCATRPASWSGPEVGEDRAGAPLLPHVRDRRQPQRARSSPSCCARPTASARRRWPAAASRRRCSRSPGRPANSAAWASRARSSSASATSWRRSRTRPSASRLSSTWSPRLRARQGAQRRQPLRDRRRHRPRRLAPLDRRGPALAAAAAGARGEEETVRGHVVTGATGFTALSGSGGLCLSAGHRRVCCFSPHPEEPSRSP